MKLPEALRPLQNRNFRIYWLGQAASLIGTWMQQMAYSWVVTRLTASASTVGALTLVGAVPMALLGLKGGQLADKHSRRDILIVTQIALAVLALGLSALVFSGKLALSHLFVFATLLGAATAFDLPASQAFAPELVPPEDIPRAVGLMQAIFHGSRLIGPALAGVAIERFGEGSAFLANAISFIVVIGSLLAIRTSGADGRKAARPAGGGGIGEGLRYVRSEPVVGRLLLLLVACMSLAFPFLVSLMAYYARYVVSAKAADMGRIMSVSGLGALAGTALLVVVGGRAWRARVGVGLVLVSGALVGLGLVRELGLAILFVAVFSLGISLYLGTISQVVQQRVPNELRGRVMALFTVGLTSIMPLAAFGLAIGADAVGLPRLMIGCGAVFGLVSAALALTMKREPAPLPAGGDGAT